MLGLDRKEGQEIIVGEGPDQIIISIAKISNNKVRIGVQAARHIPIHRREVYDKIHAVSEGKAKAS
jgi:carbon storage regulator